MIVFDFFKTVAASLGWLPEALGVLAAISLCFQKGRQYFAVFLKFVWLYISFPIKFGKVLTDLVLEVQTIKTNLATNTIDTKKIKDIVGFNGGGGILDRLEYIAGYNTSEFWLKNHPGFSLDGDAKLIDSTHAFCLLLGVNDKDMVVGGNWKSFLDKREIKEFIEEYKTVSAKRDIFRRQIAFSDVYGNNAGTWTVIGNPLCSEKARAIRYMVMLYPFGDAAKAKAQANSWPERPPI